jgi:hypothetical protein
MKKITYTLACVLALFTKFSYAQLADGSTAPDFTFTDMNGVSHNLYTYLNQGKYVAMDVSATWCPPCWDYHTQIQTMHKLYHKYDDLGNKTWKVLFIEGDDQTNDACMKAKSACSLGDWVTGTPFAMFNPPPSAAWNSFYYSSGYDVPFYPVFYLICPNKKVYTKALNDPNNPNWPVVLDWENAAKNCGSVGIDNPDDKNPLTIYPNPAKDNVGLYFNLNNNGAIKLQVINSIGQTVDMKDFGVLNAGDQSLHYSTESLERGMYFFIVESPGNRSIAKKVVIQ